MFVKTDWLHELISRSADSNAAKRELLAEGKPAVLKLSDVKTFRARCTKQPYLEFPVERSWSRKSKPNLP